MINKETLVIAAMQTTAGAALTSELFDDPKLTGFYIAGSFLGAMLTMIIMPQKEIDHDLAGIDKDKYDRLRKRNQQRLWAKGAGSLIGGWAFTPMALEWAGIDLTPNRILAFSAAVAMVIVSLIHTASPKIESLIDAWTTNLASKHKPPADGNNE